MKVIEDTFADVRFSPQAQIEQHDAAIEVALGCGNAQFCIVEHSFGLTDKGYSNVWRSVDGGFFIRKIEELRNVCADNHVAIEVEHTIAIFGKYFGGEKT